MLDLLDSDVVHELMANEGGMSDLMLLCIANAGCDGTGNVDDKLFSMKTTEAMVGLAATFS